MINEVWLFGIQELNIICFPATGTELDCYLLSECKSHSVAAW